MTQTVPTHAPGRAPVPSSPGRSRRRLARGARTAMAALGVLTLGVTVVGAAVDLRGFDQTRGGYDPPYQGWTGTPIDWSAGAVTSTGYLNPGRVVDIEMNCTTGMISFGALGVSVDYRVVIPRAIAVHQPREACTAAGFDPAF